MKEEGIEKVKKTRAPGGGRKVASLKNANTYLIGDDFSVTLCNTAAKKTALLSILNQNYKNISHALSILKIPKATYQNWLRDDPQFKLDVETIEEIIVGKVVNKLMELIEQGDRQSIIFFLETKAKWNKTQEVRSENININQTTVIDWSRVDDTHNKEEDNLLTATPITQELPPTDDIKMIDPTDDNTTNAKTD